MASSTRHRELTKPRAINAAEVEQAHLRSRGDCAGSRQDHGRTSDGVLDLDIRLPHFFLAFGCEQILALNLSE